LDLILLFSSPFFFSRPQSERSRAIQDFKSGKATTLVATDIAARGLDISTIGLVIQADAPRNIDTYTHRVGRTGRAGASGEALTLLDAKSGFGIATGLVDLLREADQGDSIPSWLQGMAHIDNARRLEEEIAISAGTMTSLESSSEADGLVTNEEFTGQDFRRTAIEGSYGAGRDTSYRSFDEEAYSSGSDASVSSTFTAVTEKEICAEDDGMESEFEEGSIEESINENDIDVAASFQRQRPSRRLLDAIKQFSGSTEIGDVPDKSLLDSLSKRGRGNQKLRFEYLGMFPFDAISPFLVSQSSGPNDDEKGANAMPRILMVAEKPSIAKAMAEALSGRRGPRQRRGISRALPVYEFVSESFQPVNESNDGKPTKCLVTVTSVVGHIFSLGFDNQNQTQSQDPQDYFHMPVVKQEESTSSKLRVIDHLRALAGESDHLVLWLDCDPEGENIAHEVMAITRQAINNNSEDDENRIHRARFSAISPEALRDAFGSLGEPDPALSRAVDARQELDLRIGVALTRLLTWRCVGIARKRFGPATRVISYGPCQTPALSFCVNRAREIEEFEREPFWKVDVEVGLPSSGTSAENRFPLLWKVPKGDAVLDARSKVRKRGSKRDSVESMLDCASNNQIEAKRIAQLASSSGSQLVVQKVRESAETIPPPLGLNTVALLEAGSKSMGMSPKQVMNVAEKLYSAGFISYPRTETTKYDPNGFDLRNSLRDHASNPEWGRPASYLLRTKYSKSGTPPRRGKDVGDHPPITPLKAATREEVGGGAAWRVYEFVVRNFLGSLHNELSFTRRTAYLSLPNNESSNRGWLGLGSESDFELELVTVDSLGFTDCCRWVLRDIGASGNKDNSPASLKKGDILPITKANLEQAFTKPPRFLQEHELILLMDGNGIGTDASMAVHVSNIVDRGYVSLCDETGQPLRGPRRPGSKPQPRQIGRYMVPTALGMGLLDIFDRDDRILRDHSGRMEHESPALLSHPSIRKQMEDEVKQIAKGTFEKDYCLEKNLDWFEERYMELEQSLSRKRIKEFGKSLTARKHDIHRWRGLGAFEAKKDIPPSSPRKKQHPNKQSKNKTNHKVGKKTGKGPGAPPKGRRKAVAKKGKTQKTQKTNGTKKKGAVVT
jgi:DNA topoisomerase IA